MEAAQILPKNCRKPIRKPVIFIMFVARLKSVFLQSIVIRGDLIGLKQQFEKTVVMRQTSKTCALYFLNNTIFLFLVWFVNAKKRHFCKAILYITLAILSLFSLSFFVASFRKIRRFRPNTPNIFLVAIGDSTCLLVVPL